MTEPGEIVMINAFPVLHGWGPRPGVVVAKFGTNLTVCPITRQGPPTWDLGSRLLIGPVDDSRYQWLPLQAGVLRYDPSFVNLSGSMTLSRITPSPVPYGSATANWVASMTRNRAARGGVVALDARATADLRSAFCAYRCAVLSSRGHSSGDEIAVAQHSIPSTTIVLAGSSSPSILEPLEGRVGTFVGHQQVSGGILVSEVGIEMEPSVMPLTLAQRQVVKEALSYDDFESGDSGGPLPELSEEEYHVVEEAAMNYD